VNESDDEDIKPRKFVKVIDIFDVLEVIIIVIVAGFLFWLLFF